MTRFLGLFVLFLLATPALSSNSITYQGQLQQSGAPFSGAANLAFQLYDAASGGNPVSGVLTRPATPVENGLFQVQLDFGAGAFDGSPRFLEVTVNGFALNPRQAVQATPVALYALDAGGLPLFNLGSTGALVTLGVDLKDVMSVSITVPQSGFAVLSASGMVFLEPPEIGQTFSQVQCYLRSASESMAGDGRSFLVSVADTTDRFVLPLSMQRRVPVAAGQHIFHLACQGDSENVILNADLLATFFRDQSP